MPSDGDAGGVAVGPVFDVLAELDAQASVLHELLGSDASSVGLADLPELAVQLHQVVTRLSSAHHTVVGLVDACGVLPAGPVTVNAWLAGSHHLDPTAAGRLRRNATWLAGHPLSAAAFAAGDISAAHVTAMRVVADASEVRREAFVDFEALVLDVAVQADSRVVGRIMNIWAETVDPEASDEDADVAYGRRSLHLSQVGDGWDVRGWLPGVLGAELAGVLNEFMERAHRNTDTDTDGEGAGGDSDGGGSDGDAGAGEGFVPVSARRVDALLDMARAAAAAGGLAGGLSVGARDRAKVAVTIGIDAVHTCPACTTGLHHTQPCPHTATNAGADADAGSGTGTGHDAEAAGIGTGTGAGAGLDGTGHDGADFGTGEAAGAGFGLAGTVAGSSAGVVSAVAGLFAGTTASWAVGNGPGQGHLPRCLARWASCDGEITRVVLGAGSRPLDVGRSQRVVPGYLRTVLNIRDGGCIIPGCDRPPGWCQAHHITHWADSGETSAENLALLCQKHHTELHLGRWTITVTDGVPSARFVPKPGRASARAAGQRQEHQRPQAA
jgi:hypothetical protein